MGLGAGFAALMAAGVGWLTRRDPSPPTDLPAGPAASEPPSPDAGATVPGPDPDTAASETAASETAASETAASETAASETAASETAASETAPGQSAPPESPPGQDSERAPEQGPASAQEAEPGPLGDSDEPPEAPTPETPVIAPDAATPGVLAVGAAYLRLRPDEADMATLLAALGAHDSDPVAAAARGTASDFAAGRTVVLDGWVLADSEARAAAVVTLACSLGC